MKRLLIATAAFALMMSACSNEEELASDAQSSMEQQKEDNARLIRMWEEAAESETEETEVDNSERHQFEVGPSKAKQRAAEEENELEDNATEGRDPNHDAIAEWAEKELAKAREDIASTDIPLYSVTMDDVEINVGKVNLSEHSGGARIDVYYSVTNNSEEVRKVPLTNTIVVTDRGDQLEYDSLMTEVPSYRLYGGATQTGRVSFQIEDASISEISSADIHIPGVGFDRSLDEMFTVYFNEEEA